MRSTRYRVSENLGAEAVLQAHQGNRTCPNVASQHNIHSNQFRDCKRYATGDRIEANAKSSERRLLDRNNRGPEDSVRLGAAHGRGRVCLRAGGNQLRCRAWSVGPISSNKPGMLCERACGP